MGAGARSGYSRAYGYRGGAYGYRGAWGGGYWHGGFWPGAYYGWSYPLFLGLLPAVYSTYWWGGVPYYYVNNVYYTYDASDNGYVATDPPPVADGYSDDVNAAAAAGPDAGRRCYASGCGARPPHLRPALLPIRAMVKATSSRRRTSSNATTGQRVQTGFDPTSQSSSGAPASTRSAYGRAMAACLDARGYTVR